MCNCGSSAVATDASTTSTTPINYPILVVTVGVIIGAIVLGIMSGSKNHEMQDKATRDLNASLAKYRRENGKILF